LKITHLDHVEDLLFAGHFIQAYDTLDAIVDTVSGEAVNNLVASVKYDGAPSIVFGRNPENARNFIGTKSVFNRTPKIAYSNEDIDRLYGSKPELAAKLKAVFKAVDKFPDYAHIWQADLLWTSDSIQLNDKLISFTPNTITYHFDAMNPEAEDMHHAEVGMVIHTKYAGTSMDTLEALPAEAIDTFRFRMMGNDAYFVDPSINLMKLRRPSDDQLMNMAEHMEWLDIMHMTGQERRAYNACVEHKEMLRMFINYCVKMGEPVPCIEMYRTFLQNRGEDELAKDVTPDTGFGILFAIHERLTIVKKILIYIMSLNPEFYTEVNEKPVKGEGFVVTYHGVPCKLVDRLEFSRLNFMNKRFAKA
jgi:hypothetical protein